MTWVPVHACTLPTAEQPLRVKEFDDLFSRALRDVVRTSPTSAALTLAGGDDVERSAADLAARESSCCSFFGFDLERTTSASFTLRISVPPAHATVLDALVEGAAAHLD